MKKSMLVLSALSMLVASVSVFAGDKEGLELFKKAEALYQAREKAENVVAAIKTLNASLSQAESTDLKYDALILMSRAYYYQGTQAKSDEEKMKIFESGYEKAQVAKILDDTYAEGYFLYAINLGKWAEAKGILSSLSRKAELIENAEGAAERITRTGEPGETYDSYGPARVLGRIYFKLPGFAGGSNSKSIEYLKIAYENGSEFAMNVWYYAEVLAAGYTSQKNEAKRILDKLLSHDPETYNEARVVETRVEFEEAKKLRRQLGN